MTQKELRKKYSASIIPFIFSMLSFIVLIIYVGELFPEENPSIELVILVIAAGILSFVVPLVIFIRATLKYKPLINVALCDELKKQLDLREGKTEFQTEDERNIRFDLGFLTYENRDYSISNCIFTAALRKKPKGFSEDIHFVLEIVSRDIKDRIIIPFDGDLFDAFEKAGIRLINQEDLSYYLDHIYKLTSNLVLRAVFLTDPTFIPILVPKNQADKKQDRKAISKKVLIQIAIVFAGLGVNVLFVWLGDDDNGFTVSDTFSVNLGFKVVFSLILFALAFVKAKKVKWFSKFAFILYLLAYWFGLLFLNERMNNLVEMIFFVVFAVIGIVTIDKEQLRNGKGLNRNGGFACFLALMLIFSSQDYTMIDESVISGIAGISAGVMFIISLIILFIVLKKNKDKWKKKKKEVISTSIVAPFAAAGACFALVWFGIMQVNFIFDRSTPVNYSEEIVELIICSEDESDVAVVILDNHEIEIPISRSQIEAYEVGDEIQFLLYSGALDYQYFIYEDNGNE